MRMLRKRVWLPVAGAVVLAVVVSVAVRGRRESARDVRTEAVARRSIESWVRAPGAVRPLVKVEISSNVTGRVDHLHVREGDRVRKGDLLLTLDGTRFRSAVDQNEAMLRAAHSQLTLAEAQLEQADSLRSRREDLFQRGLLSSEELENARIEARVQAARTAAQREEVERITAALAETRRNLEETVFLAPMDGIVTSLNLEEGENVVIGTMNAPGTVILTVSDLARMEIEARVSESDVVRVRPGQTVRIEVDAEPDSALAGLVSTVGESGDRQTQDEGAEFDVRVAVLAPPAWLKPGMSADVAILAARADSVVTIPIQALVARDEETIARWERGEIDPSPKRGRAGSAEAAEPEEGLATRTEGVRKTLVEGIFVVRDGKAHFRRVQTGVSGESYLELISGTDPGDQIITGPYRVLRKLREGEPVKVKPNAGANA
jgi:HlyD family secretion protein